MLEYRLNFNGLEVQRSFVCADARLDKNEDVKVFYKSGFS